MSEIPTTTRLYHALGPILGAVVLDAADFVTFGPVGVYIGFFVGLGIGWWLGGFYGFDRGARWTVAIAAGIYTMIPMTEFIPLATLISAFARFDRPHTTHGEAEADSAPSE